MKGLRLKLLVSPKECKNGMTNGGMDVGLFVDSRLRGNDTEDEMT